jgi:hypothetical protein
MTLRDAIASDATAVFLNSDDFAESVTYHPHRFYGSALRSPRAIKAVVIREQVDNFAEDVVTVLPRFEVHVANDATNGISSTEIDTGGDQLEFPARDGKAAERRAILKITTQDNGMLVLECR